MTLSIIVMIAGILFFGYITASVAASLANADTQRGIFADKLAAIKVYIEDHKVPQKLRDRVVSYYRYMYMRTKGINPKILFDALPQSLWADLSLDLYKDIIQEVSLFRNADPSFIKMICKCIQPGLYPRGEFIIRQHDIGEEMYFIRRGIVDLTSENGKIIFDTMTAGQAFGEVALLFECPRTASFRARTNCDLFVLSKVDLERALQRYPDVKQNMINVAKNRLQQARCRTLVNVKKNLTDMNKEELKDLELMCQLPSLADYSDMSDDEEKQDVLKPSVSEKRSCSDDVDHETRQPCSRFVIWLKKKASFTINPNNRVADYFSRFISIVALASCFLVSLEFAFQEHHYSVIMLNYICDLVFLINIILQFHLCYYSEEGDLIEDFHTIVKHYVTSKNGFIRDLLAFFPFEVFALVCSKNKRGMCLSSLRLPRLLRVLNVIDYFRACEKELEINMLIVRLLKNLVILFLGIHVLTSIWYIMACPPWEHGHCVENSWVEHTRHNLRSIIDEYCTCLYWCVATVTSTGYGDEYAYTTREMAFAVGVMVFGTLMFGFILGNIASTLQSAEANRIKYEEMLSGIKKNMREQNVPKALRKRVVSYFSHLWLRTKGVNLQSLFDDCPMCLHSELALSVTRPMLNAIPLFEKASESFLRQICVKVTHEFYLPEDYIVRKDEVDDCLLYIHRGRVEIISEDDPPLVIEVLKEGDILGEANLFIKMSRQVTARALTHIDVFSLNKDDLDKLLVHYPEFEKTVREAARERFADLLKTFKDRKSKSLIQSEII